MKSIFAILFVCGIVSAAGVFDAEGTLFYGDSNTYFSFEKAQVLCQQQGMSLAPYDLVNALKANPSFVEGATGLGLNRAPFWVQRLGYRQGVALFKNPIAFPYVAESQLGYLCARGGVTPPGPGPLPPPVPVDGCYRYTELGVSACLNNASCDWSTDSRKCFSRKGFDCHYYTQHGVNACLNTQVPNGQRCDWSTDSRQCFQKQGYPCGYYTQHGVSACLQSSSRCDWSTQARKCYDK